MLKGLQLVSYVFILTLLFSIPLGLMIALLRHSSLKIISRLTQTYLLIMRGTPLLLQLIVIYYGLPLVGITFNRLSAVLIAFSLNYAAYFAEIFRGGLESIPKGQFEAAKVLGLNRIHTYRCLILPQVIKKILAPLSNEVITLVKDTSLVYILGLNDILRVAQIAANRELSLFPLIEVAILYLIIIALLSKGFSVLEKRYAYYA